MRGELRGVYAEKAITQIPRLLSNLDRNPFSPTYGCFHRDYWLYKTSDFPDAVRQFAVHALALVYRHDFPGNIYKGRRRVRDWTIAALDFWARIQHRDGSFDEFYPYERGWVGPTAFTTYASIEAFRLLEDEVPDAVADRVREAVRRAAMFISAGEHEEDHLANHHAMACLAVWKSYELLGEPSLRGRYDELWRGFLGYHNAREGWSREYDGVDPGYLSATVSFLAKIYQTSRDPEIKEVLDQSVRFCSYFAYPDGYYAGTLGSRNTLHFYPHGFELLGAEMPLATAVAEKMLRGLSQGTLVSPEIMSDRYVAYRVQEYLLAHVDYFQSSGELPSLPCEGEPVVRYFPEAGIFVQRASSRYVVANLAKGGVVKVFDTDAGHLSLDDAGIMARSEEGRLLSTQWIGPDYERRATDSGFEVQGRMHLLTSQKLFTPVKQLIFRAVLVLLGWNARFCHLLKGRIRRALILGGRPSSIRFRRRMNLKEEMVEITDELWLEGAERLSALVLGGAFSVRYVPQSRFFQAQELDCQGLQLGPSELEAPNDSRYLCVETRVERGLVHREVRRAT